MSGGKEWDLPEKCAHRPCGSRRIRAHPYYGEPWWQCLECGRVFTSDPERPFVTAPVGR